MRYAMIPWYIHDDALRKWMNPSGKSEYSLKISEWLNNKGYAQKVQTAKSG